MNPEIDAYISKAEKWREELRKLRAILLDCQLTEHLKWGKPCYAFEKHNVVLILPMKETCALLLFKGGLLKDPHGILIRAGENAESGRQIRFTSVREINEKEAIVRACIHEAVEVAKAGLEVPFKKVSELKLPEELQSRLDKNRAFKKAFEALTPGRQKGYIFHISGAKQSKTRESRIDKCLPRIFDGKGLVD